ncbi:hypothetical protein Pan241w_38010 [Gimesia alba]|uniref:Uncharacterized protein n=1 Tax=Gimesia alba TaxID=2527973 RepID=A0A517RIK9_9PLAN|nr:hypothetical protein Pan241w_38010 [Gimesia alba]
MKKPGCILKPNRLLAKGDYDLRRFPSRNDLLAEGR